MGAIGGKDGITKRTLVGNLLPSQSKCLSFGLSSGLHFLLLVSGRILRNFIRSEPPQLLASVFLHLRGVQVALVALVSCRLHVLQIAHLLLYAAYFDCRTENDPGRGGRRTVSKKKKMEFYKSPEGDMRARVHELLGFFFIFLSHFRSLFASTIHASFPATETGTLFIHYRYA